MVTTYCRCGQAVTYTATKDGGMKDVRHVNVPGKPEACPK